MKTIKYEIIKVKDYKRILKDYIEEFRYYKFDEIKECMNDNPSDILYPFVNIYNLQTNKLADDFITTEGDPFFILENAPIKFVTALYIRLSFVIDELDKLKCNDKVILCDIYGNNDLSPIALALMGYHYDVKKIIWDNLLLPEAYEKDYYIKGEENARNNQKISK